MTNNAIDFSKLDLQEEIYETCLLGWYFGIEPTKVKTMEWTVDELSGAQKHCEIKHIDPVEFWK